MYLYTPCYMDGASSNALATIRLARVEWRIAASIGINLGMGLAKRCFWRMENRTYVWTISIPFDTDVVSFSEYNTCHISHFNVDETFLIG